MRKLLLLLLLSTAAWAQSYVPAPIPRYQFFNANGQPLAGGFVYTFSAGTTTQVASYADSNGDVNPNPIPLDSGGYANIWIQSGTCYKFVAADSTNVQQWSADNICGYYTAAPVAAAGPLYSIQFNFPINSFGGNANFTYNPTSGAFNTPTVNNIVNPTSPIFAGSDLGAQINSAITNYPACAAGCTIEIPAGSYTFTTTVNYAAGVTIRGSGLGATVLNYNGTGYAFSEQNTTRAVLKDLEVDLGPTALGVATVSGGEYHIFDNVLSYNGTQFPGLSALYRLTGSKTQYTNLVYFLNVKGRNFNGAGIWADHVLDLFLTNDDFYGATNNLTSQALVIDSEVSGINATNFVSGYSGAHALVIENTFSNTAVTGSVSSGSAVSVPVTNSGLCIQGQGVEIYDGTNSERPTISSIPDSTHVVLSALSHNYTTTATVSCGFAPNDFQVFRMVADTCTGGDCIYMSGSLNHGAGSTAFAFGFTNTWAAGAGVDGNGVCQTPAANGYYIRGGTAIKITAGEVRSNCGNGILIDKVSASDLNLKVTGVDIYDNSQSGDNLYDGIQVTQSERGLIINGNKIGSLNGGAIEPRYGINISATGGTNIVHSNNDLHFNRTGSIVDATTDPSVASIGNTNNSQADLFEQFANPLAQTFIGDSNYSVLLNSGNPEMIFQANGSMVYTRATPEWCINMPSQGCAIYATNTGAGTSGGFTATGAISSQGKVVPKIDGAPSTGQAVCWKTSTTLGYCSTTPTSGTCTCN